MSAQPTANIEPHIFPHIFIAANPTFRPETPLPAPIEPDSNLTISPAGNAPGRFIAQQRIRIDRKEHPEAPYWIDVVCICNMQVKHLAPEKQADFAAEAAHALLLPAIRELIHGLTARQPWGPFSIGFASLKKNPEVKAVQAKTSAAKTIPSRRKPIPATAKASPKKRPPP